MKFTVKHVDIKLFSLEDMQNQKRYALYEKKAKLAEKKGDLETELEYSERSLDMFDKLIEMLDKIAVVVDQDDNTLEAKDLPPTAIEMIMESIVSQADKAVDPND